jgi:hypothetical protein
MAFKTKELAKAYRERPNVKAKKNAKAREKYKTDSKYREERIKQATSHRKDTVLGTVMSRLRINNHYARKNGYAECKEKAQFILDEFSGKCDLCKKDAEVKDLVIDHDHTTGQFRGWLCGNCNSGLGYFNDSTYDLALAISYLYRKEGKLVVEETKESNPKDMIGSNKVPLSLVPGTTKAYLAVGHLEGHTKYGFCNWRHAGVRLSIYLDALERHVEKLKGGEWSDPSTNVPHLANAITCLSIIIDAYECGKLIDDRPLAAPVAEVIDKMSENVVHLKKLFGDKKPVDYFIDGAKQRE